MTDYNLPSIKPFTFVWKDAKRTFGKGKKAQTFHVIGYGAYDAFGLIGTEFNGIAICSVTERCVITDNIAQGDVGDCGTPEQRAEFDRIMSCSEDEFKVACKTLGRPRYA